MSDLLPAPMPDAVYVPTIEDLTNIFQRLPSAERCKDDILKIPVTAQAHREVPSMYGTIQYAQRPQTLGIITFKKFVNNGKKVWIYDGIVLGSN